MNRRTLLKSSLPILAASHFQNANAFQPRFAKTRLKKNVVLVTNDLGLYADSFQQGKNECRYFNQYFKDFKGQVTYFNQMSQPGIGGGHTVEHATFTTLKFNDRDENPHRQFISLDQHLAEYSLQQTRHKFIYHKVTGGGRNVSFNSLAQPAPSYNGLEKLHEDLFGYTDMGKVKQDIAKKRFILKELYNNTKRRWKGSQEEKDMIGSIDYKIADLDERVKWLKVRKPKINARFKINEIERCPLKHAHENFTTIFNALEKEQTKIALVQFGGGLIKGLQGINHGYHTLSHHGNYSERIEELQTIDGLILESFRGFLNQLKESKLLDDTIVLFKCGMADASRHSSKHVPAFLFGGGFKHKDYIDCADESGHIKVPTTHLYSTILKQAGFNDVTFSGNKEIIKEIL